MLDRQIGAYRLPDGWFIVATGNRLIDKGVVNRMPSPLVSRMWHVELQVSIDAWTEHALDRGIVPELIAFFRLRAALLNNFDPKNWVADTPYCCPRTVEFLSRLMQARNGKPSLKLVCATIGESAGIEFYSFLDVYKEVPSLDAILLDPDATLVPEKPAALYAVMTGLARKVSPQNADRVFRYLARMPKEFEVCGVRDCQRANKGITQSRRKPSRTGPSAILACCLEMGAIMNPQLERIRKQRINLVLDEPFFGSLLLNLKLVEDSSVSTFTVNSMTLRFNPQFAESLSDAQLRGVLVHEVCHCALLHPFRRGLRDLRKFNLAADYALNNFLENYTQETARHGRPASYELPGGAMIDHRFDNYSTGQIYDLLPDSVSGNGGAQHEPNGPARESASQRSVGDFEDAPGNHAACVESEAQWKVALTQAVSVARCQGKFPQCFARLTNEALHPSVPWQEVLRNFFRDLANDNYSWSRPNKRFLQFDIYLPSLVSLSPGEIVVALDTSGSITQKLLAEFLAEVQGLLDFGRPRKLHLLDCDAAVHSTHEFVPGDRIDVQLCGGGGTDFRPVFDYVAKQGIDPCALVYLTDLYGTFPEAPPPYPVLWVSHGTESAPFGQVLKCR